MAKTYKVLGLMSGSSLDGLDIAYCSLTWDGERVVHWEISEAKTYPYPEIWERRLAHLPQQNALAYARTHTYLAHYWAGLVRQFLAETQAKPDFIASHGHTIYHHPQQRMTSQIGDGAALAALTGLDVVSDFRTQDVALDGEGTPLAPVADKYLFSEYRYLLNLGGIANLTVQSGGRHLAYDICPCNQVLNALAMLVGQPYDAGGGMAASGSTLPELEAFLHRYPYFLQSPPKSLDNKHIQDTFMAKVLAYKGSIPDRLHTCCKVLGQRIAEDINQYHTQGEAEVLVTGGGAFNTFLLQHIQSHLDDGIRLYVPPTVIVEYKEALLMALLGMLRLERVSNCWSAITGSKADTIGGAVYLGSGIPK